MFTHENAAENGRKGGLTPKLEFKMQAKTWVRENGFVKAVEWVNSGSDRKATFAMGLLFSYALGRPAENIQVHNTTEVLLSLANDPAILEAARSFGANPGRIRQAGNVELANGAITVQAESPSTPSV